MNPEVITSDNVKALARQNRQTMTQTEKLLWEQLENKKLSGYRFRRQHPVYRYILDFYCAEKRLAIELDGEIHKQRKDYDEYRDEVLKSIGIETLRINAEEVINKINDVLNTIKAKLEEI